MKINQEARQALEINDVLKLLSAESRSDLGRKALLGITPASDMQSLISRQNLLAAYQAYVSSHGDFPWSSSIELVSDSLTEARHTGLLLGDELLKVRTLLTLAGSVKDCAQKAKDEFPPLVWFCGKIRDFEEELQQLSVINSDGTLADSASKELREIRAELAQKRRDARSIGNAFINGTHGNMLQEKVLSMRGGRFVVLVKQNFVSRFPGIVTDKSVSGNSVYMEPHQLTPLNNRIAALLELQRQEERRIFGRLTKMLLDRSSAVCDAEDALAQLDLFFRMDQLMTQDKWCLPELLSRSEFCFYSVRHPMLGSRAVPVDAYCGKDFRSLVITGPNTGGKTVALKTCALAVYLAWCGMPIPAHDGSSVGNISSLYADIGDEQSIEQSLSTFSSHLKRIAVMLREADANSLVLLDELGAGTDPQEGAALGIAVLEEFLRRKTLVMATTHHNPIKRFATSTPGIETACVDFDMKTLSPTYHLLVGIPGQSNALAIAKRYGIPDKIVRRAEECLDGGEVDAERLIGQLQEKRVAVEKLARELAAQKQQLEAERKSLQKGRAASKLKRDEMILKAEREAQKVMDRAEEKARELLKSLTGAAESAGHKEMAKHKQQLDQIRSVSEVRQKSLEARHSSKDTEEFRPGSAVKFKDGKVKGEIISISGKNAEIQVGPMRISAPLSKLVLTSPPKEMKTIDEIGIVRAPQGVPSSIMVRGLMADEAIPMVENYLDKAMRAGYGEVSVIHGRGEGILRKLVHQLCDRLPYVAEYRLGDRGEGGWGVTIVRFR